MRTDRRQFLKFLAFIPFVASKINFYPNYGVGGVISLRRYLASIITPTAKAKKAMDNLGIHAEWSIDGKNWYCISVDHPFYQPFFGDLELKTDRMIGGIIIDKDSNSK